MRSSLSSHATPNSKVNQKTRLKNSKRVVRLCYAGGLAASWYSSAKTGLATCCSADGSRTASCSGVQRGTE